MACENRKMKIGDCICVLLALSSILSNEFVNGRRAATMEDSENGDIIDCVDIYKQPAFNNPLLKNHTIQMKPSFYPKKIKEENLTRNIIEARMSRSVCPEGTIPILRTQKNGTFQPFPSNPKTPKGVSTSLEYAQVGLLNGNFYGAQGYINVWTPQVSDGDYSAAQVWVSSGGPTIGHRNIIQAGWMKSAPDRKTRLVIGWTRDGYQKTGCYNLDCPGFVHTSRKVAVGLPLAPISSYGGQQYEIRIGIHKDMVSGHWWVQLGNEMLGYWPHNLFTSLSKSANYIHWGGEVRTDAYLTRTTQMGSGHFPQEGMRKASFVRSLGFVDENGFIIDPKDLTLHVINPSLYDVVVPSPGLKYYGTYFLFGGPGHRP